MADDAPRRFCAPRVLLLLASILCLFVAFATAFNNWRGPPSLVHLFVVANAALAAAVMPMLTLAAGDHIAAAVLAAWCATGAGALTLGAVSTITVRDPAGIVLESVTLAAAYVAVCVAFTAALKPSTEEDRDVARPDAVPPSVRQASTVDLSGELERDAVPEERYVVQSADPRYASEAAEEAEVAAAARAKASAAPG